MFGCAPGRARAGGACAASPPSDQPPRRVLDVVVLSDIVRRVLRVPNNDDDSLVHISAGYTSEEMRARLLKHGVSSQTPQCTQCRPRSRDLTGVIDGTLQVGS